MWGYTCAAVSDYSPSLVSLCRIPGKIFFARIPVVRPTVSIWLFEVHLALIRRAVKVTALEWEVLATVKKGEV